MSQNDVILAERLLLLGILMLFGLVLLSGGASSLVEVLEPGDNDIKLTINVTQDARTSVNASADSMSRTPNRPNIPRQRLLMIAGTSAAIRNTEKIPLEFSVENALNINGSGLPIDTIRAPSIQRRSQGGKVKYCTQA